ncbi:MAG UNVERIFIED_CONTAM: hypothetical protein LVR29_06220 [Microcystis novacekii LVE1205-3]
MPITITVKPVGQADNLTLNLFPKSGLVTMTFEPKKFNQVFEDMRQRTVLTDFEVGSVARTVYESFAYEIALLYEKMRLVYLSAYVDTAEGQTTRHGGGDSRDQARRTRICRRHYHF